MLHDPNKEYAFNLDSLIAWLETKPADETYDYLDGQHCMCAQYFQARGYTRARVTSSRGVYSNGKDFAQFAVPAVFDKIARNGLVNQKPQTFGHALEVARNKTY
jgi:hypothetical protein